MASPVSEYSGLQFCSLSYGDTLEDLLKGSYYANPVEDKPTVSSTLRAMYPEYYGNNICKFQIYASSRISVLNM